MEYPKVVIHLPRHLFDAFGCENGGYYVTIYNDFKNSGASVELRIRKSVTDLALYEQPHFHFVHHARLNAKNILNTGSAYLRPYHYMDNKGIYMDASLASANFNPAKIPAPRAAEFLAFLKKSRIETRKSKHEQPEEKTALPKGAIAVFLQGWSEPAERARLFSEIEMIDIICAANGNRPVIVKQHPRNFDIEADIYLRKLMQSRNDIIITDANVHDILEAADVTCTVASGVGMESFIHETPVILFGRTDFHHCAYVMKDKADFPTALQVVFETHYPYARFLAWFLRRNCVNMSLPNRLERIVLKMRNNGYDVGALGLKL